MVDAAVIITGAASGIGRACVELFTVRGFGIVAVDVDEGALRDLADSLGGEVVPLVADVSLEETGIRMTELALSRFGRLDVAVLNAGIGGTLPWEAGGAIERLDEILAVNVRGVAIGIRSVAPALRDGGGGSIVVTASSGGLQAEPGNWAYNASKGAVVNLVRAAALDYAAQNIRVNAVAPGLTETPMLGRQRARPAVFEATSRRIPLQRWSRAEEQAAVVWFLASAEASYITGTTLVADGGMTAHHGAVPLPPLVP
ncbi:SDR family NAD(P)-dependent oxidoreductase [Parafrankia elaeagni]|uniref:SDR family NAD(P)-dependent oxidoreductase n=1 Tax=Parafrankia elaeagni TaxID=222534 RepID=UPI0004779D38|nr:SDR family oxidoreductase [Parafrankia elaeagni]